jgi:hypothetical protein
MKEIRKLHINLPRQPVVNQAPWLVAGLLIAILFLVLVVFAFFGFTR